MKWYVLQVMTGSERDVCTAIRRKGVQARAPAQRMEIRRRGRWQTEERLLLPGYVFVGAEYTAALFHLVSPVSGVIRWLGLHCGEPQALDAREALRWRLDSAETLGPSRVIFFPGGWNVLDGPLSEFAGDVGPYGPQAAARIRCHEFGRHAAAHSLRRYPGGR